MNTPSHKGHLGVVETVAKRQSIEDLVIIPMHPIQSLAFWKTKPAEIAENVARYDLLVGDDPEKKKLLDELITFVRGEAVADELYNQGDC